MLQEGIPNSLLERRPHSNPRSQLLMEGVERRQVFETGPRRRLHPIDALLRANLAVEPLFLHAEMLRYLVRVHAKQLALRSLALLMLSSVSGSGQWGSRNYRNLYIG